VSIYAVDPRGLTSDTGSAVATPDTLDVPPIRGAPASAADGTVRAALNDVWVSQQNLRTLSEQTGGFAVVNANQFDRAFERIVADNSSYYVLAYYPPSTRRDGRFHRIEVRVNRPGVTVRARRGYAAPRGGTAPAPTAARSNVASALAEAFSSPLPSSGIRMKVFAAPFKAADRQASVLVGIELDGRDLTLDGTGKLEVSYLALDPDGKMRDGRTDTLALNLRPDTRARVEQSGLRTLGRLTLPPGRYQLRAGALDSSGRVGATVSYLDIPDYNSQPLSTSGIVLTSLAGTPLLTTRADEALKGLLPAPPIAARTFAQGDEIALFAEAYDSQAGAPHKVDVSVRVTAQNGAVLFRHEEERDSAEFTGSTGGYGISVRIPVADLPVGEHVLTVEARSRLAGNATAARHLTISVVPERQ
jgi:hypothetical protein